MKVGFLRFTVTAEDMMGVEIVEGKIGGQSGENFTKFMTVTSVNTQLIAYISI